MTTTHGTVLDAVGRAKHTLTGARGGGAATVTVHGVCPVSTCGHMNVVDVHADTTSIRCEACGAEFSV